MPDIEELTWESPWQRQVVQELKTLTGMVGDVLHGNNQTKKELKELMANVAEVTAAVEALTTDLGTKLAEVTAELTKLEGEIENPAALEALKGLVEGADNTVKGFVVPTA